MRSNPLAALGIDYAEPLPELSALAEQAIACWNFSDGWAPERWPMYGALYPVADWYALVELMRAIRDEQTALTEGRQ